MVEEQSMACVFGYQVSDPERYGVAEFDKDGNCLSIEENLHSRRAIMLSSDFISILMTWWKLQRMSVLPHAGNLR